MEAPGIRALLYDGRSATGTACKVALEGTGARLRLALRAAEFSQTFEFADLVLGERVGSTHRLLELPHGASLEIIDNPPFDAALAACGVRRGGDRVRVLEQRWHYAVLAAIATLIGSVLFLRFGLPPLAAHAVHLIPPRVDALIGQDTLKVLDRTTLGPTTLPLERQAQLRAVFGEVTQDYTGGAAPFTLVFRSGGRLGPNAVALPSGLVILTDQLVALSANDDELRGVFAHEVGHVVNRHAMRMLAQSSASAVLITAAFGDLSGAASLAAAAPSLLVDSAYSRDFEREADAFAFAWMSRHNVSPEHLGDLLARVAAKQGEDTGGYLASHPDIQERVAKAHGR